ncbi:response regulator [Methylobacterium sp. JK268]
MQRPLAQRRILVVEDEYFVADDMARALGDLGAEVVGPAPSREQALALLAGEERIDAAVLDINLRGESAFPVAEALAARAVPYVFATGYDRVALPEAFREVPHWEKPFDPTRLARMLARMLAAAE